MPSEYALGTTAVASGSYKSIDIDTDEGRSFNGSYGDGLLDDSGNSDNISWPDIDANGDRGLIRGLRSAL
jgi:hypothetical protein